MEYERDWSYRVLTSEDLDQFARDYYLNDDIATVDLEELAQLRSVPRLVEAIGDRLPVLEMGFGTGLITDQLLRSGLSVEVLEGSPILAEQAIQRHRDLVVHLGLFESFQSSKTYGSVLALHVLEHVDDPVALLRWMRRWLDDDGQLIVVVPNCESFHRRIAVHMGLHDQLDDLSEADHMVGHRRVYDLDGLIGDVEAAGYTVTDDFGYLLKTVPNSMMLGYPPAMVEALNQISPEVPTRQLANIGVCARPQRCAP